MNNIDKFTFTEEPMYFLSTNMTRYINGSGSGPECTRRVWVSLFMICLKTLFVNFSILLTLMFTTPERNGSRQKIVLYDFDM